MFQGNAGAAPPRGSIAGQRRDVDECGERRCMFRFGMILSENRSPRFGIMPRAGRLDGASAQVIAEIAAGIARGAGIDAGRLRGAQKFLHVRAEGQRIRRA